MTAALIAGGISVFVAVVGVLSSVLATRAQKRDLERKIQNVFTDKLYAQRLEHYPSAFEITDRIERRKAPQHTLTPGELRAICDDLLAWKTGIISLLLSRASLAAYYELVQRLGAGPSDRDTFSAEQADRLMQARNRFRGSLRTDVGFLHSEDAAARFSYE